MEIGKEQEATFWNKKQTPKSPSPSLRLLRGAGKLQPAISTGITWQLSGGPSWMAGHSSALSHAPSCCGPVWEAEGGAVRSTALEADLLGVSPGSSTLWLPWGSSSLPSLPWGR